MEPYLCFFLGSQENSGWKGPKEVSRLLLEAGSAITPDPVTWSL